MESQRWIARWIEGSEWCEFKFESVKNWGVALIDARLQAMDQGIFIPERFHLFELQEGENNGPATTVDPARERSSDARNHTVHPTDW